MPGPTPHYPPEFKREAVELYRSSERSIPKVAKELGIADESLRRWIRQHQIEEGQREGLTTEERQELSRLRKEVRVLKQEREFLKKAAVFLAKDELGDLLQAHRGGEDELSYPSYVPDAKGFKERLLHGGTGTLRGSSGWRPHCQDPRGPSKEQRDLRLPEDPR